MSLMNLIGKSRSIDNQMISNKLSNELSNKLDCNQNRFADIITCNYTMIGMEYRFKKEESRQALGRQLWTKLQALKTQPDCLLRLSHYRSSSMNGFLSLAIALRET